ncbi:MAG: hypothetical protein K2R98_20115 [Gemmataceae bacterium]|nr:hypothetical protein [Gemmataceae bacterium]
MSRYIPWRSAALVAALLGIVLTSEADVAAQKKKDDVKYPPTLPGDKEVVTDTSDDFLKPAATLKSDVAVAKAAPTIDFLYFPGQTYAGKPWSNWGDSLAANSKYYASIGDHLAPAGNAFVYEYDPEKKTLRRLVDVRKTLDLPDGHYTPGKIHGRLDLGDDGCLYFSTHRGSTTVTTDQYHYKGDWIFKHHIASGKTEVVACGPVPKHCIPCSVLDPKRLIFYGGTAPGNIKSEDEGIQFFAYDTKAKKVLYAGPDGPARYMLFAKSTGRVYWTAGKDDAALMRYDPEKPEKPVKVSGTIGLRAATQETADGFVYTVSQGRKGADPTVYQFNTKTEEAKELGSALVGAQGYIASIDADPTGRYLYYVPGAHGSADVDGTPVVQYDVKTQKKKVLAFLHPFYKDKYGCALRGTYSSAIDAKGDKLYITWNANRGSKAWDTAALTVIHIPESERRP